MILGIDHVGIAVADVATAGEAFARLTGRSAGEAEDLAGQGVLVCFVPGAPAPPAPLPAVGEGQGVRGTTPAVRGTAARLELLEPVGEDSALARFAARRGEGLHHVCFAVDDIRAETARLVAAGFEFVDREPRRGHGGLVVFLHPKSAHGVLIELLQRDEEPALSLPKGRRAKAE